MLRLQMNKIFFGNNKIFTDGNLKNLPAGYFILNNGNWEYADKSYQYKRIRDRIFINKNYSIFFYIDIYKKEVHQYTNSYLHEDFILNKHQVEKVFKFIILIIKRMKDKIYQDVFTTELEILSEVIKWNIFSKFN